MQMTHFWSKQKLPENWESKLHQSRARGKRETTEAYIKHSFSQITANQPYKHTHKNTIPIQIFPCCLPERCCEYIFFLFFLAQASIWENFTRKLKNLSNKQWTQMTVWWIYSVSLAWVGKVHTVCNDSWSLTNYWNVGKIKKWCDG